MDPFDALGLPRKFALAPEALDARVRELLRVLHPDKHAQATPAERRMALSRAVTVNEAYRTLRDEVSRAEALLHARGLGAANDASADPDFLLRVMELREALADARAKRDRAALDRLGAEVEGDAGAARAELEAALDEGERPERAARALGRLRYARRFLEEHAAVREELDARA